MNIVNINRYHWVYGGKQRYVFNLAKLLESEGHVIFPFAIAEPGNVSSPYDSYFPPPIQTLSPNRLERLKAASTRLYNIPARKNLSKLLRRHQIQLAHVHEHFHLSTSIFDALSQEHIPTIYTMHDFQFLCPIITMLRDDNDCTLCNPNKYYQAILHKCSKGLMANSILCAADSYLTYVRKIPDMVDCLITPSQFAKSRFVEFGWPEEKINVLPYFARIDNSEPKTINNDAPIVFAGRLIKQKGVDLFIRALHKLHVNKTGSVLIVGDGPERRNLESLRDILHMEGTIKFVGQVDPLTMNRYLDASRFIVVPSTGPETFGLAVLEPFIAGRPVVACRVGAYPEIVTHGVDGLLCDTTVDSLAEQINWMLTNPDKVKEMGIAARKKVEVDFSPKQHYEKLMVMYEKSIRGK